MINVNKFKDNWYSANGEDGILQYLLTQIDRTGFVIEFGAADGLFYSNTARLWRDQKSTEALLIESDEHSYANLVENTYGFSNVQIEEAKVFNIDDHTTRIADVCSIDVDGNDYHIAWRMQTPHQIVVIEHNPTVPVHVDMIGIEDTLQGSSAKSICYIMDGKGYTLVAATKTNLFFLRGDHTDRFESRLEVLFDYSALNYIITSYDGQYDTIGEFGYGYTRPTNLRLKGRDGEISRTTDSDTMEHMRQMFALDAAKNGG